MHKKSLDILIGMKGINNYRNIWYILMWMNAVNSLQGGITISRRAAWLTTSTHSHLFFLFFVLYHFRSLPQIRNKHGLIWGGKHT